jgi:hypothetical protein
MRGKGKGRRESVAEDFEVEESDGDSDREDDGGSADFLVDVFFDFGTLSSTFSTVSFGVHFPVSFFPSSIVRNSPEKSVGAPSARVADSDRYCTTEISPGKQARLTGFLGRINSII